MKSIPLILTSAAAVTLVGIAALADDSNAEKAPSLKAPAKFTNSTPTPSEWALPSANRLFVSKQVHEVVLKKGGPGIEAEMKDYEEIAPRAKQAKYKNEATEIYQFIKMISKCIEICRWSK